MDGPLGSKKDSLCRVWLRICHCKQPHTRKVIVQHYNSFIGISENLIKLTRGTAGQTASQGLEMTASGEYIRTICDTVKAVNDIAVRQVERALCCPNNP